MFKDVLLVRFYFDAKVFKIAVKIIDIEVFEGLNSCDIVINSQIKNILGFSYSFTVFFKKFFQGHNHLISYL